MTAALVALLMLAAPAEGRTFAVEPAKSTVRYHIVHKLHRVSGASSTIEVVSPVNGAEGRRGIAAVYEGWGGGRVRDLTPSLAFGARIRSWS
jgi:hypothetical protein